MNLFHITVKGGKLETTSARHAVALFHLARARGVRPRWGSHASAGWWAKRITASRRTRGWDGPAEFLHRLEAVVSENGRWPRGVRLVLETAGAWPVACELSCFREAKMLARFLESQGTAFRLDIMSSWGRTVPLCNTLAGSTLAERIEARTNWAGVEIAVALPDDAPRP